MNQPNEYLGGECPIDLVETEGAPHRVLAYIHGWIASQSNEGAQRQIRKPPATVQAITPCSSTSWATW